MNRRRFLSHSSRLLLAAGVARTAFGTSVTQDDNRRRTLSFSNEWIESVLVSNVRELPVDDAIVVNLSPNVLHYKGGENQGTIPSWKSTTLRGCTLVEGTMAALLHVRKRTNLGAVALGWDWYGRRNPQFSCTTTLYISSQDDIGDIEFDPLTTFAKQSPASAALRRYRLKLNLWYTPEETDCGIHTGHRFLEVHTQVLGTGHMQKFRDNNADSLYQDVLMPAGFTHDPFFMLAADRSFTYPWHRYYADTDCIWMAIELHPLSHTPS